MWLLTCFTTDSDQHSDWILLFHLQLVHFLLYSRPQTSGKVCFLPVKCQFCLTKVSPLVSLLVQFYCTVPRVEPMRVLFFSLSYRRLFGKPTCSCRDLNEESHTTFLSNIQPCTAQLRTRTAIWQKQVGWLCPMLQTQPIGNSQMKYTYTTVLQKVKRPLCGQEL